MMRGGRAARSSWRPASVPSSTMVSSSSATSPPRFTAARRAAIVSRARRICMSSRLACCDDSATVAPRYIASSMNPSLARRRSASRTGTRDTLCSSATASSRMRSPGLSSPDMIRCRSTSAMTSLAGSLRFGPVATGQTLLPVAAITPRVTSLLVLRKADIADVLAPEDVIEVVERAMRAVAEGGASEGSRTALGLPGSDALLIPMFGAVGGPAPAAGLKLLTDSPANPAVARPRQQSVVFLLDPATNAVEALLDGAEMTRAAHGGGLRGGDEAPVPCRVRHPRAHRCRCTGRRPSRRHPGGATDPARRGGGHVAPTPWRASPASAATGRSTWSRRARPTRSRPKPT